MEFGLFFTLAINAPIQRPVETIPHRDSMNLAFGVCAIFVYGKCSLWFHGLSDHFALKGSLKMTNAHGWLTLRPG